MERVPNPPPHMVFFEPLDDRAVNELWIEYKVKNPDIDYREIDAAVYFSIEDFARTFELWINSKSSKRIKLLMIWHAHFLSLASQQSIRRLLETKSFKARVWFHLEYINNFQPAILSRCILRNISQTPTSPEIIYKDTEYEENNDKNIY